MPFKKWLQHKSNETNAKSLMIYHKEMKIQLMNFSHDMARIILILQRIIYYVLKELAKIKV